LDAYGILLSSAFDYRNTFVDIARPPHILASFIFNDLLKHFTIKGQSIVKQCSNRVRKVFPELLEYIAYRHYGDAVCDGAQFCKLE